MRPDEKHGKVWKRNGRSYQAARTRPGRSPRAVTGAKREAEERYTEAILVPLRSAPFRQPVVK